MALVLLIGSIAGSGVTAALVGLIQHSVLAAVLIAPLGGSLVILILASLRAARMRPEGFRTTRRKERIAVPPGVVWGERLDG